MVQKQEDQKNLQLKISKYCNRTIYYSLLALTFLLPLIYLPCTYSYFETPKLFLLRTITIISIAAWLIKIIVDSRIKLKRTFVIAFWLFYLMTACIATILSINKHISIYGELYRFEGLLTLMNYAILFLITLNHFDSRQAKQNWLNCLMGSALIVSLSSIFQRLGLIIAVSPDAFDSRSFATFGNPLYLGAFLTITIPLTASYLLIKIEEEKESESYFLQSAWFWIITILVSLQICALLTTFSRGAWLGLAVGLFVFILQSRKNIVSYYRQLIPSLAVILIITSSAFYLISLSANSARIDKSIGKRALSTFEITEGTSGNRLYIWKMSLPMISNRPFFGYGLDSYGIVFPEFRPSDWYKKIAEQAVPDKAHNDLLQVGVDQGICGLTTYIALIAAFLLALTAGTRKRKSTFEHTLLIGVIAATVAYLVQLQFSFSVISVAPLFWMLAGIGLSNTEFQNDGYNDFFEIDLPKSTSFKAVAFTVVLLASLYLLLTILLAFMADFYAMRGHNQLAAKYYIESIEDFEKATSLNSAEAKYYLFLEEAYFIEYKLTRSNADAEKIFDILDKAEKLNPYQTQIYFSRGNLYREMAGKSNKQLQTKAIKEYKKILKYDPNNADAHFNIAVGYFDNQDYDSAISYWKKTINLDPKDEQGYIGLGESYKIKGQHKKSKEAFEAALRINPYNTYVKDKIQGLSK